MPHGGRGGALSPEGEPVLRPLDPPAQAEAKGLQHTRPLVRQLICCLRDGSRLTNGVDGHAMAARKVGIQAGL